MARLLFVSAVLLALGGCADPLLQWANGPSTEPAKVYVSIDTFCAQVSKTDPSGRKMLIVSYQIGDTPETVTGIEAIGATYDKLCPKFAKVSQEHVSLK